LLCLWHASSICVLRSLFGSVLRSRTREFDADLGRILLACVVYFSCPLASKEAIIFNEECQHLLQVIAIGIEQVVTVQSAAIRFRKLRMAEISADLSKFSRPEGYVA
jgi:hypothetical protein